MAGRYSRYKTYSQSDTDILKEIPRDWSVSRLKRVVDSARPITYGIVQAGPNIPDGVPYIRPVDMTKEQGIKDPESLLKTSPDIAATYKRSAVEEGDLVVSIGPSFGKIMVVPSWLSGANLTQGTARVAVSNKCDSRYLFWVLRSQESVYQWESAVGGATFRALNLGPLSETTVLKPPPQEQKTIARFLDHETAKIDELIAKQERLIELLKEKRKAVISHAVTKGLNPDVPMKDSGVEWLGEVPEHWRVMKFSHCANIRNGQVDPTIEPFRNYILIAPNHIESGTGRLIEQETALAQGADSGKYLCKKDEIIYSKIRPGLNKACLSPGNKVICSADMYPIQATNGLLNEFLHRVMLAPQTVRFCVLASERVAMPKVNREALAELRIAFPPEREQREIVDYIAKQISKVDLVVEKGLAAIELLKERRTALISAAVTGKIDVRYWKPDDNQ